VAARVFLQPQPASKMDSLVRRTIQRLSSQQGEVVEDLLVVEQQVELYINSKRVLSTACSPDRLRELAYGYVFSEGIIDSLDESISYDIQDGKIYVALKPTGPLRNLAPVSSDLSISREQIFKIAAEAHSKASVFQQTGGTHVVTLYDEGGKSVFVEDISRTCALDKVIGEALASKVDFHRSFLFLSSRLPQSMMKKIGRCGIPIVGSISAPTSQAVDLAEKLGITLCGFVRGERFNIYSHSERILK
jgi:FdhD protein